MIGLPIGLIGMVLTHGRVEGPANGIYAGGTYPGEKAEGIAAAAITPGTGLVSAATDGEIQEGGAGATKSTFIGIAAENLWYDAANFLVDFVSGRETQYYNKSGEEVFAVIKNSSSALVYGNRLKLAANGEFEKFVEGTDDENLALLKYIGRSDLAPPATGVNRYLCRIGGDA